MNRKPQGIFIPDAIIGMTIIGILTGILAVAVTRSAGIHQKMADDRDALAKAENTLLCLQAGQAIPDSAMVKINYLESDSKYTWVRVTAKTDSHPVSLIGLVPTSQLQGGKP